MRKFRICLGIVILASIAGLLLYVGIQEHGIREVLIGFGIVAVISSLIMLALYLIIEK
jgi:hypothetical protein